jgi:glucose-6-phosphate isomerase
MIKGVSDLVPRLQSTDLSTNLAAYGALLQYGLLQAGHSISVFMPYSARMMYVADWYVQLWAESLGKRENLAGEVVHVGSTPLRAVGVTDQHAQVQLFNEGPHDKSITFVRVGELPVDVTIPDLYPDKASLNYLGGHQFSELMNAEADATRAALTRNGRPNMTYTLPVLDAYHWAQLLFVLEFQTAVMGGLLKIDPFNQPGVELGKQYTYALMGRDGYDNLKAEMQDLQPA